MPLIVKGSADIRKGTLSEGERLSDDIHRSSGGNHVLYEPGTSEDVGESLRAGTAWAKRSKSERHVVGQPLRISLMIVSGLLLDSLEKVLFG